MKTTTIDEALSQWLVACHTGEGCYFVIETRAVAVPSKQRAVHEALIHTIGQIVERKQRQAYLQFASRSEGTQLHLFFVGSAVFSRQIVDATIHRLNETYQKHRPSAHFSILYGFCTFEDAVNGTERYNDILFRQGANRLIINPIQMATEVADVRLARGVFQMWMHDFANEMAELVEEEDGKKIFPPEKDNWFEVFLRVTAEAIPAYLRRKYRPSDFAYIGGLPSDQKMEVIREIIRADATRQIEKYKTKQFGEAHVRQWVMVMYIAGNPRMSAEQRADLDAEVVPPTRGLHSNGLEDYDTPTYRSDSDDDTDETDG